METAIIIGSTVLPLLGFIILIVKLSVNPVHTRYEIIKEEVKTVRTKFDSLSEKITDTTKYDTILKEIKEVGDKLADTKLHQKDFVKREHFDIKIDELSAKINKLQLRS